ncbi:MAG TPA: GWxTD domain-containing protein [Verrucomicrobiae bacterium]|nr:GWxTD domain-containing protein [Verrucomicrobiae bacterium]
MLVLPKIWAQSQQEGDQQQTIPQDTGDMTKAQKKAAGQAAKERSRKDKDLYKELASPYKKWLDEDVVYIITPEERSAFLHLSTNEEREQFIEQFWQRRNPDPDSPENTYKEEHYRRIAYANEHFASGIPGWKTDRGRIYIMWGPPDEIDSHPSGGTYDRPADQGGGETSTYPFEDWRYRYLAGIGENVELEFVDPTMTGEYHLTSDPSEKDALLYVPNAGLTLAEEMGMSSKQARFNNTDGTHLAAPLGGMVDEQDEEFTRLEKYAAIMTPPPVKFKDLEAIVTGHIVRDQLKFDYRFDFMRITSDTVLVPITVQIPTNQLMFQNKDGVDSATVNLFGRISTLSGRVVQTFEDTVHRDIPASLIDQASSTSSIYQKAVPLSPNLYRLDIVIKDINSGNVGVVNTRLAVPHFEDDQLSSSSLVLADQITEVSAKDIGLGQFVIGDVKVRPKMDETFAQNEPMGVFLQVYNLKIDDKTHKPDASVEFRVLKGNQEVLKYDMPKNQLPERGEEMTLKNLVALNAFSPGRYKLEVAITDNIAKQTITPSSDFSVKAAPVAARPQGR